MCLFRIYVLSFLLLHGYFIVAVTTLWSFFMLISTIWPARARSGVVKTQKKGMWESRRQGFAIGPWEISEGGRQLNELSRSRFSDNKFRFSAITILRVSSRNFIEAEWFSLITLWATGQAWMSTPTGRNMAMTAGKKVLWYFLIKVQSSVTVIKRFMFQPALALSTSFLFSHL